MEAVTQLADVGTVARELNLTERRINQLVRDGLPRHSRGQYPLAECFRWYVRYLQTCLERKAIVSPDGERGYAAARLRREVAEAGIKEIELARERGHMVAVEDVEKAMSDLILSTKARVLGVSARAAGELAGLGSRAEAQTVLDRHLREALKQMEAAQ
jgi:phage terminase Nu1 subunit (DNA packaging protein)